MKKEVRNALLSLCLLKNRESYIKVKWLQNNTVLQNQESESVKLFREIHNRHIGFYTCIYRYYILVVFDMELFDGRVQTVIISLVVLLSLVGFRLC